MKLLSKFEQWFVKHKLEVNVIGLILLMVVVGLIPHIIVTINSGYEAVLWRRLFSGTETEYRLKEGTRFKLPWDKVQRYDMRLQEVHHSYHALSNNGVSVKVNVTLRFRPRPEFLPELHKFIGPGYVDVLVLPRVGSNLREEIVKYQPETLYSMSRSQIETQVLESVRNDNVNRQVTSDPAEVLRLRNYVVFENLFITNMALPERVVRAIEKKEAVKQESLTFDFRLEIARKEALRKKIEAEGIRDFQNTINQGISDKYLTWKGIEATLELAQSENSKVVVIGSAKDGLPIILGGGYTADSAYQGLPSQSDSLPPSAPAPLTDKPQQDQQ